MILAAGKCTAHLGVNNFSFDGNRKKSIEPSDRLDTEWKGPMKPARSVLIINNLEAV